jgi:hypothetical protein
MLGSSENSSQKWFSHYHKRDYRPLKRLVRRMDVRK